MTQYNRLNVKLCNSQLDKFKSSIKNGTELTLNLLSNLIGNSNDETNFPHALLLTDTKVSKIPKAFGNSSSANIRFLKAQLSKMIQSGGWLADLIEEVIEKKGGRITLTNNETKEIKVVKSLENR